MNVVECCLFALQRWGSPQPRPAVDRYGAAIYHVLGCTSSFPTRGQGRRMKAPSGGHILLACKVQI